MAVRSWDDEWFYDSEKGDYGQLRHKCPKPRHAWPKAGALWFDVKHDPRYKPVPCPDCLDDFRKLMEPIPDTEVFRFLRKVSD